MSTRPINATQTLILPNPIYNATCINISDMHNTVNYVIIMQILCMTSTLFSTIMMCILYWETCKCQRKQKIQPEEIIEAYRAFIQEEYNRQNNVI